MRKKAMTLSAVLVALSGFVLGVFIPAASAEKGHCVYMQYCDNGTNTVYSAYSEHCETTSTTTTTPKTS